MIIMAAKPTNPTSNSPNAFPSICVDAIRVVVIIEVVGFPVYAVVAELIVVVVVK